MIIKLNELKGIMEGLSDILSKELPVQPAYLFGKLAKKIRKEFNELEENRMKLVHKYALKDSENNLVVEDGQYKVSDRESFAKEFSELLETEVEIEFTPVSLEKLGDVKISPKTMIDLEKFVGE